MTDVTGRAERPLDLEPAARRIAVLSDGVTDAQLPAPTPPGGPFGPAVEVPADAPLLDRVIGLSGRDPSWWPSRRSTV